MGCSYGDCDGNDKLPFDCRRCGQSFCSDHRLPEKHNCPGGRGSSGEAWFPDSTSSTSSGTSSRLRTVVVIALVAVAIAVGAGFVTGSLGTVPAVDTPDVGDPLDGLSNSPNAEQGLNETEVERLIHEEVNEYRSEQGVSELAYDDDLAEIAEYHSQNMAEDGEIYHTSPGGQTVEDRYERFGYDCRVSDGEDQYRTSGENVAQTWYEVQLTDGEYHGTPEELAEGIVQQWINSSGHRENLVDDVWRRQGIGVAVTEEDGNTAVYVTQNFC